MLKDIQDRADITKLVHTFYGRLLKDEDFRHIFLEVAEIDILDHFEIIIDFWESVLLQARTLTEALRYPYGSSPNRRTLQTLAGHLQCHRG